MSLSQKREAKLPRRGGDGDRGRAAERLDEAGRVLWYEWKNVARDYPLAALIWEWVRDLRQWRPLS